jgi:nucleoside-diphosphate-sugar epimerase
VKDFASYIVKSIGNPAANRKVYQIAGDTVISFKDLIKLILQIRNKSRLFVPVPVFVASNLGRFFQATQKIPVFTAEHVKGVLQDSKLDTSALKRDLNFDPTPLKEALEFSLDEIGTNWDSYIAPRTEQIITLAND